MIFCVCCVLIQPSFFLSFFLPSIRGIDAGELQFLKDAAMIVVASRKFLRWSYVFGYYLQDGIHCDLFESMQGLLEQNVECLHELVEAPKELLAAMVHIINRLLKYI